MKSLGPLSRTLALAGLFSAALWSAPAMAAKADVELLQSYIGNWKGRGELIGAEKETVVCRLSLSPGNADKVNYSGRCSLAGTALSVNGTLAYNDSANRFEAVMSSNATFNGLAVGRKSGNGLVFNLKEREKDTEGNDMTISAQIALNSGKIKVEFNVVFNATGDSLRASVPFTK
jgi:opacity protein-like surface antigen